MNIKQLIKEIENINNFSSRNMTEAQYNVELGIRLSSAMDLAASLNVIELAISYYNFKYLKDIHGDVSQYMQIEWKGMKGTEELAKKLVEMSKETLVDIIYKQSAWGSKQVLSLPYGDVLASEMVKIKKSSLGTKDIIYLLFGIKAKELGFTYYDEFVNLMKEQKTMVSRKTAQDLLKLFWENTKDDYKTNPNLFNIIKSIIINLNSELKDSNSTQQLRLRFMEQFINLTMEVK